MVAGGGGAYQGDHNHLAWCLAKWSEIKGILNDGEADSSETKGHRPMTRGVIPDCWTPIHNIPIRVVTITQYLLL